MQYRQEGKGPGTRVVDQFVPEDSSVPGARVGHEDGEALWRDQGAQVGPPHGFWVRRASEISR